MKCISFALLVIGFVLVLGVTEAAACTCRQPPTTTEERLNWFRSRAKTVILGKVVSRKVLSYRVGRNAPQSYTHKYIRVERFWGAPVPGEVFYIEWIPTCTANLRVGESYLIFTDDETKGNKISTGYCSGNRELAYAAEYLKLLGEGSKPKNKKISKSRNYQTIEKLKSVSKRICGLAARCAERLAS